MSSIIEGRTLHRSAQPAKWITRLLSFLVHCFYFSVPVPSRLTNFNTCSVSLLSSFPHITTASHKYGAHSTSPPTFRFLSSNPRSNHRHRRRVYNILTLLRKIPSDPTPSTSPGETPQQLHRTLSLRLGSHPRFLRRRPRWPRCRPSVHPRHGIWHVQ